jgi:hypothetical protein
MADITEEKRAWVRSMLGVDIPSVGEHQEPEAEGHEGDTPKRARGGHHAQTAKSSDKPVPPDFPQKFQAARSGWVSAMDNIDGQIGALQKAMAKSPDEEIRDIAQFGLNGVTGGFKVLLMGYMQEMGDGSNADALHKSGENLLGAVADFRALIGSDEQIAVMDDNPFGCPVSIKSTLGPALDALEAAVKHGLGG